MKKNMPFSKVGTSESIWAVRYDGRRKEWGEYAERVRAHSEEQRRGGKR